MSYPVWWEDTITIYNKYTEPSTHEITWYRTVLTDCFWKYIHDKVLLGNTVIETAKTICRIPENDNYLDKYLWNELDDKTTNFTLGQGDIIVHGEVDDEIDESTKGSRSSDLITQYKALQGCIEVETISDNTKSGTNNKHYLVSGN